MLTGTALGTLVRVWEEIEDNSITWLARRGRERETRGKEGVGEREREREI